MQGSAPVTEQLDTPSVEVSLPRGALQVRGALQPATLDAEARTVEVVWTTGARVRRSDFLGGEWFEELSLDDDAVDLARLNNGAAVLAAHESFGLDGVIGVVERAWLQGGKRSREGRALVRFSSRDAVAPIIRDVQEGVLRHISVGYITHELEEAEPTKKKRDAPPVFVATRWEPVELSFVAVPADAGAGVRSSPTSRDDGTRYPCAVLRRSTTMSTTTVAERTQERPPGDAPHPGDVPPPAPPPAPAPEPPDQGDDPEASAAAARASERDRIGEITSMVRTHGLDGALEQQLIRDGTSVSDARKVVLTTLARKQPTIRSVVDVGQDGLDRLGRAIENQILFRVAPKPPELTQDGRDLMAASILEMGRRYLEAAGVRTAGLTRVELAGVALGISKAPGLREGPHSFGTTGDFPTLLANVAQATLTAGYSYAPKSFPPWTQRGTLPDFRPTNRVALGSGPKMLEVPEHAEYKRGRLGLEGVEPAQLKTWGRILAFTRQAMVNDDLGLFERIPQLFGNSAAQMESDLVYQLLTANPIMADGNALFSVAHGNLMTAAAITVASMAAARSAMVNQKSPDGSYLAIFPRYLIVGPQQEIYALQFLAPLTIIGDATQTVPDQYRSLQLIVEPRITDLAWYLAADPAQVDTIQYNYLAGAPQGGPGLETREGWDVDGVEFKAREDFGANVISWRGLVKNPGALPTILLTKGGTEQAAGGLATTDEPREREATESPAKKS